ncbi:MAG TPA: hypothetical protein VES61_03015 [Gaiellaceae bacterium]|nr:hypothetical protein [Gaiellaceae bacterium]
MAEELAFLQELERVDETLQAAAAELDELGAEVERVRLVAAELEAFQAQLPVARERLEAERAEAARQAADALRAGDEAEASLQAADRGRSEEAAAGARRAVVRTRDAQRMAERRVAELGEGAAKLAGAAAGAIREAAELEEQARELATAFGEHSRLTEQATSDPAPGLAAVVEWGRAARAALFVARGGLNSEREAVIRQANELGSVLLGEPVFAVRPAVVRRRVEERAALQP